MAKPLAQPNFTEPRPLVHGAPRQEHGDHGAALLIASTPDLAPTADDLTFIVNSLSTVFVYGRRLYKACAELLLPVLSAFFPRYLVTLATLSLLLYSVARSSRLDSAPGVV